MLDFSRHARYGFECIYLNITYPGSLSKPETQVDDFFGYIQNGRLVAMET